MRARGMARDMARRQPAHEYGSLYATPYASAATATRRPGQRRPDTQHSATAVAGCAAPGHRSPTSPAYGSNRVAAQVRSHAKAQARARGRDGGPCGRRVRVVRDVPGVPAPPGPPRARRTPDFVDARAGVAAPAVAAQGGGRPRPGVRGAGDGPPAPPVHTAGAGPAPAVRRLRLPHPYLPPHAQRPYATARRTATDRSCATGEAQADASGELRQLLLGQLKVGHGHQGGQLLDRAGRGDRRGDGRPGGEPGQGDRRDLGAVRLGDLVEGRQDAAGRARVQVLAAPAARGAVDRRARTVLAGEEAGGEGEVRDGGEAGAGGRPPGARPRRCRGRRGCSAAGGRRSGRGPRARRSPGTPGAAPGEMLEAAMSRTLPAFTSSSRAVMISSTGTVSSSKCV